MKAYVPAEHVVTREILDDPEQAGKFDNAITEFADHHQLDYAITDAFKSDSVPLHYVNLPREDQRYADDALYWRQIAIGKFAYGWHQTYHVRSYVPTVDDLPDMKVRPGGRGLAKQIMASVCVWRDVDSLELLKEVEQTRHDGLMRSELLYTGLARLQFNYAVESPSVWEDEHLTIDEIPQEDLEGVFGPGKVPPNLTFQALAEQMRTIDGVDLSKETLDARLQNFLGQAQLEIVNTVLEDLAQFGQTGGDRMRKALSLAEQYKPDFLTDNIIRKQEILLQTAAMFRDTTPRIKNNPLRRAISSLSGRLRTMSNNLDEFMVFFANTYNNLGYEVPAVLFEIAEEPESLTRQLGNTALSGRKRKGGRTQKLGYTPSPREVITVAAPSLEADEEPAVAEAPAVPAVDPAVEREISNRVNTIKAHAGGFDVWRMSTKTRKGLGFDAMQRQLSEGYRNVLGRQLLPPLLKDQAQELIDVMARIDVMAQKRDPEAVREQIAKAIDRRRELYVAEHNLREYANANGHTERIELPTILDIEHHTGHITREWNAFRQLILDTWPKYSGARVAERLGSVLAPPPPEK